MLQSKEVGRGLVRIDSKAQSHGLNTDLVNAQRGKKCLLLMFCDSRWRAVLNENW